LSKIEIPFAYPGVTHYSGTFDLVLYRFLDAGVIEHIYIGGAGIVSSNLSPPGANYASVEKHTRGCTHV
jgi:hypothetical protein